MAREAEAEVWRPKHDIQIFTLYVSPDYIVLVV
jgi:hypothetical protein